MRIELSELFVQLICDWVTTRADGATVGRAQQQWSIVRCVRGVLCVFSPVCDKGLFRVRGELSEWAEGPPTLHSWGENLPLSRALRQKASSSASRGLKSLSLPHCLQGAPRFLATRSECWGLHAERRATQRHLYLSADLQHHDSQLETNVTVDGLVWGGFPQFKAVPICSLAFMLRGCLFI